jgi:hypothetical protein
VRFGDPLTLATLIKLTASTGEAMSAPAEPEQRQFCARFSKGRRCPQGRNCHFIHKWALYHAVIKERKLAKLNDNHGDAGNKFCTQNHGDTLATCLKRGMSSLEILAMEHWSQSRALRWLKSLQPPEGRPGNLSKMHSLLNLGSLVARTVERRFWKKSIMFRLQRTVKDTKAFKPNKPLANMSSDHHAGDQKIKGQTLQSLSFYQMINQGISRNMGALSINTQWANSNWQQSSKYGGNYANTPGPRTAKETELAQVREAR